MYYYIILYFFGIVNETINNSNSVCFQSTISRHCVKLKCTSRSAMDCLLYAIHSYLSNGIHKRIYEPTRPG